MANTELREPVRWFAARMEAKLAEYDSDRGEHGWSECTLNWLFERCGRELQEAADAAFAADCDGFKQVEPAIRECADVANFAMMIADVLRIRQEQARADG